MNSPLPSHRDFEVLASTAERLLDEIPFSKGRIFESKEKPAHYKKYSRIIGSPECEVRIVEVFGRLGICLVHSSLTVEYRQQHYKTHPLQSSIRWNEGDGLSVRSSRLLDPYRFYTFDQLPTDFDAVSVYGDLAVPLGKIALVDELLVSDL